MTGKADTSRDAVFLREYEKGESDYSIARACGVERWAVQSWRRRVGLPANGRRCLPFDEARALALHKAGHTDRVIAQKCGVSYWRVFRWRHREAVAAIPRGQHIDRPRHAKADNMAWSDPLWSACRRAVGDRISSDIAEDAVSDMVVDVLAGVLPREKVRDAARRYSSAVIGRFANRFGPASLDEDRDGEGWTRHASTPDPAAAQPFRLVELIHLAELRGIDWRAVLA